MTIKEKVIENKDQLLSLLDNNNPYIDLIKWGKDQGFENRTSFSLYKKALKSELKIDFSELRKVWASKKTASLKSENFIELYTDASSKFEKFAITNSKGDVVWHGRFFEELSQARAELESAKKAVWLARAIADKNGLENIKLILNSDAQWLLYFDSFLKNPKNAKKASELGKLALKMKVELDVKWIPSEKNLADSFTKTKGYMHYDENLEKVSIKKTQ